jgi:Zn finger protein HypA/HybF involved in hydrogenase expression
MEVVALTRTLDQEVLALVRGASLECLACGEFVMRAGRGLACPECSSRLEGGEPRAGQLELGMQAS